jgi:pimeloyl-ACP methyl ester carboxylesterase
MILQRPGRSSPSTSRDTAAPPTWIVHSTSSNRRTIPRLFFDTLGSNAPTSTAIATEEASPCKLLSAIRGLVRKIVAAAVMINHDGANPEFWESMKQAKLEKMPAELHEAYLKVAPHPEQLQTFFDKSVRRMLEFKDWRPEEIRSIQAPTMVLIGDADIVRPEHGVEMFRLLPHARLAVLPLTDHMTLLKRTDWLVSMIEMFLDAPMPQA